MLQVVHFSHTKKDHTKLPKNKFVLVQNILAIPQDFSYILLHRIHLLIYLIWNNQKIDLETEKLLLNGEYHRQPKEVQRV